MEWLTDPHAWIGFITLTALEVVLGIDNIIFISILSGKLPQEQQSRGRRVGLFLAMIMRILLLLSLAWIMRLTAPLFSIWGNAFSGRDLILISGGLFLLAKSTHEIHEKLEGNEESTGKVRSAPTFTSVIIQIMFLDIIFSLDSVITAVGMINHVGIMIAAIILAVIIMMIFADTVS